MILDKTSGEVPGQERDRGPASPPPLELVSGLSSREKARRLLAVSRDTNIGQRTLAFYLHEMHTSGDYKDFGCATALRFATDKLEMCRTTAQRLLRTGAELTLLPRVDGAFCRGDLSWSKVCLVSEIAVPETEKAWLDLALRVTIRELQREVASTEKGRAPRGNRRGLPRLTYLIQSRVDELQHEAWETARQKLQEEVGETVTNARLATVLAEAYLRNGLGQNMTAPRLTPLRGDGKKKPTDTIYHLAVEQCPTCRETVLHKEEGAVILSEEKARRIEAEAVVHAVCDGSAVFDGSAADAATRSDGASFDCSAVFDGSAADAATRSDGGSRAGSDCSAASDGSAADAATRSSRGGEAPDIDDPTPAWMRKFVLACDGFRCRCCGRKRRLMAHHVEWRSKGGRTHPSNLVSLCDLCHAMAHEGKLTVEGTRETGFGFLDASGEPIERPLRDPAATRRVVIRSAVAGAVTGPESARQGDECLQGVTAAQRWAAVHAGSAPDGASRSTGSAPDGASRVARPVLSFESLPETIGAAEWPRIAPCLVWNERRRTLEWKDEGLWGGPLD